MKEFFGFGGYEPHTISEVAYIYSVTQSTIRKIENGAIKKLRYPKYLRMLLPDYDLKIKQIEESKYMIELNNALNREVEETKQTISYYGIAIEELELTVRTYNALKRAGINNVGELCKRSKLELGTIRNLGKASMQEITDALHNKYGIILK
jgi:DNA-directed RNA polymerase alpha subunit